ncbi:hypothetical protein Sme01_26640 [Sphaerisporangium melleum]|uniref:Uncharacterized protein n=1 Tax=Sphaerisporangium melleum TaxID=321316 RepID=A0A917VFM0_9ACTN|nr:hypothetical protein [Sphaerisporangium melleum]GGK71324.1 hypothetical protein GCM10007964_12700 [Sphaerisporangium melleum]GII70188.1 hypothetical protein Sme01_26640 [Sphaerisporangium melleum]
MAEVEWMTTDRANFAPGSVSAREGRCTWHGEIRPGEKCPEPPVTGVRAAGGRWLACERAVDQIVEQYGVARPAR